jgi:hypothetical protein
MIFGKHVKMIEKNKISCEGSLEPFYGHKIHHSSFEVTLSLQVSYLVT